jgi:uncharacterized repeat protein (TIGR03803 family)
MTISASLFRSSRRLTWGAWALTCSVPLSAWGAAEAPLGTLERMHSFNGKDGKIATSTLIMGSDGRVHGAADTSFRMKRSGEFKVVNAFNVKALGTSASGLTQGTDGQYYGVTMSAGEHKAGTAYRMTPQGEVTVLHHFDLHAPEGGIPATPLLQASDGAFYGTTSNGGDGGRGSLFRVSADGDFKVLHHFSLASSNVWASPEVPLLQASDGHLYGTTRGGGAFNSGAIYRWKLDGKWDVLYSFQHGSGGGDTPASDLVQAPDGMLYGTTESGGDHGGGTFYRFNPGTEAVTLLYHFSTASMGVSHPVGTLLRARDGYFYGVATLGGKNDKGGVFRLSTAGEYTQVHDFPAASEMLGYLPQAGLVEANDGVFFGTFLFGGEFNQGAIYRLKLNGRAAERAN